MINTDLIQIIMFLAEIIELKNAYTFSVFETEKLSKKMFVLSKIYSISFTFFKNFNMYLKFYLFFGQNHAALVKKNNSPNKWQLTTILFLFISCLRIATLFPGSLS